MFLETLFLMVTPPIAILMNFFIRSDLGGRIGDKLPYHPRLLNWVWTTWGGLFWLPCPLCKKNFGGHEWKESIGDAFRGEGVCPKCVGEAKKINKENEPMIRKQLQEYYTSAERMI